jgi:hypothetical protein
MKVLIDEDIKKLIKTKFRSHIKEILHDIKTYSKNPSIGKRVAIINNFEVWQVKTGKGNLRLLFAKYKNVEYVLLENKFKDVARLSRIAMKNKSKKQQKYIDEILNLLKNNGLDY